MQPADIVMINQLLALYGHIVDAAQWDRFDELFRPDAELDYTQAGAVDGHFGSAAFQRHPGIPRFRRGGRQRPRSMGTAPRLTALIRAA